jgi:hypothetical protein
MTQQSENLPQPTQCSTPALMNLSKHLQPATAKAGTGELMACLTLVAPSGMSAEDRTAWVAVARQTLSGIPADLLQRGCKKARETCRFASEIVPAILDETRAEWARRRKAYADEMAWQANKNAPRLEKPDYVTPEQMRELIQSLGKAA